MNECKPLPRGGQRQGERHGGGEVGREGGGGRGGGGEARGAVGAGGQAEAGGARGAPGGVQARHAARRVRVPSAVHRCQRLVMMLCCTDLTSVVQLPGGLDEWVLGIKHASYLVVPSGVVVMA